MASLSGYVTRSQLGLGNLAMFDYTTTPYVVFDPDTAFDPQSISAQELWARSAWTPPVLVSSADDTAVMNLKFLVTGGGSFATVQTNVATLLNAVRQMTFQLSFTSDTTTWVWSCYRRSKEHVLFDQMHWFGSIATVELTIRRNPTPVSGPY